MHEVGAEWCWNTIRGLQVRVGHDPTVDPLGGVQPSDGEGPYAAAKASVIALTATTALNKG